MSDIAGPPVSKPLNAVSHGTDKAGKVSRDPNQTPRQATDDSGENRSKSEGREAPLVRDPAVSISASAAHLRIGEELRQKVSDVDSAGRPIIVTETATFALRPDAGLKQGDDVILQVTETGKTVAADLLNQNGRVLDPPIKLSLVVIAVHSVPTETIDQPAQQADKLDISYRPTLRPNITTSTFVQNSGKETNTEDLAKVLSREVQTASAKSINPAGVADNPDPLIRSNSSDLAALIAAQQTISSGSALPQGQASKASQANLDTASVKPTSNPFTAPVVSTRILPPSALTDVSAQGGTGTQASSTPNSAGLGPSIPAISSNGIASQIQLLDLSISQVSPSEIADVISVQPLPVSVAKSLPVGAQALGAGALATLETSKGSYILPQSAANSLIGGVIRITSEATPDTIQAEKQPQAQTQTELRNDAPIFAARLTSSGTQGGRQVQVQFTPPGTQDNTANKSGQTHIMTTISAVHTLRAFLTGDGPKTDLKIDTPFGALTMTLAGNMRPSIGDGIAILPNTPSSAATATTLLSAGAQASGVIASAAAATATSSWPSFEQAYVLLESGAPVAASALNARSAQGGPKLLNSLMFLMAAIKGGSPTSWIGKSAGQALDAKNGDLLRLLKDDLGQIFRAGSDTQSEWRALSLPFDARSSDMPMLTALFSQPTLIDPDADQNGSDPAGDNEEDQRFIVEVQFSVLGAIQLDGIIRGNHFDLTLWSTEPLSPSLSNDTQEIFSTALQANGFKGRMRFKESSNFPVDVAAVLKKQRAA